MSEIFPANIKSFPTPLISQLSNLLPSTPAIVEIALTENSEPSRLLKGQLQMLKLSALEKWILSSTAAVTSQQPEENQEFILSKD